MQQGRSCRGLSLASGIGVAATLTVRSPGPTRPTHFSTSIGMATKMLQQQGQLQSPIGSLIAVAAMVDDVLSLVILAVLQSVRCQGLNDLALARVLHNSTAPLASASPSPTAAIIRVINTNNRYGHGNANPLGTCAGESALSAFDPFNPKIFLLLQEHGRCCGPLWCLV